jgi:2-amino-4-deoxychorismate synthase
MDFITSSQPYCLLYSPKESSITYIEGLIKHDSSLADIDKYALQKEKLVSLLPFSLLREKGFSFLGSNEPIVTLIPTSTRLISRENLIGVNVKGATFTSLQFNLSDDEFVEAVKSLIHKEINLGEGSNFLLSRKSYGKFQEWDNSTAINLFSYFLIQEPQSYLTFCFFDGENYYIGASPEQLLSISSDSVEMRPICGTLPKSKIETEQDVLSFLKNEKEINELFQVVDETLKMMCKICSEGGSVDGPVIKEMSALLHTEYILSGKTNLKYLDALRLALYPPTMIGSPLENAARVVSKYENDSRRYYSAGLLIRSLNESGEEELDSAITIRMLEVSKSGNFTVQTGASIVRDSVPEAELEEIKAKATGLYNALDNRKFSINLNLNLNSEKIVAELTSRNKTVSQFWVHKQSSRPYPKKGESVLIIDNEDEFTYMLSHLLQYMGYSVNVVTTQRAPSNFDEYAYVLLGPGPGDPRDKMNNRIAKVHEICHELLHQKKSFLAVCLGHQVLCQALGLSLMPVDPPLQGVQKEIDFYGDQELVGFYNTFFATGEIQNSRMKDFSCNKVLYDEFKRVVSIKGDFYYSVQFHIESILTRNNISILQKIFDHLGSKNTK